MEHELAIVLKRLILAAQRHIYLLILNPDRIYTYVNNGPRRHKSLQGNHLRRASWQRRKAVLYYGVSVLP